MKENEKAHARYRVFGVRGIVLLVVVSCATYSASSQTNKANRSGQSGGVSPSGATAQPGGGRGATAVLVSPEEDYRIGANDVIDIQIESAPELSRTFRVTAAGTFLMPYVGRITAIKKTTEELAQLITDGLKGDYLKDPKVTVTVKEYNSRSFFIQGSVRSPGVYQIEGRPSVLELITLASGLSDSHGATAYIIRRIKSESHDAPKLEAASQGAPPEQEAKADEQPKYELKSANINALLRGHFEQDVSLEPGDIVNIPPGDVFFVAGEVNQPGSFPLKEGTTLRQAISLAQGTNYKAAVDRCIIFRESSGGKRDELRVDVGAIMNGKKEDIGIMGNDIIYLPNSKTRTIGGGLLRAFGYSAVTRLPIP